MPAATASQWIIATVLLLSAFNVILAIKPVHACLSFLLSLLCLAALYLQLSAEFIAVMQVLVYAGAILVIFMFVIILFQDAHIMIDKKPAKSYKPLIVASAVAFILSFVLLALLLPIISAAKEVNAGYATIQSLGKALYIDFFFPFEAVIFLFLVALVGTVYLAKKEKEV